MLRKRMIHNCIKLTVTRGKLSPSDQQNQLVYGQSGPLRVIWTLTDQPHYLLIFKFCFFLKKVNIEFSISGNFKRNKKV